MKQHRQRPCWLRFLLLVLLLGGCTPSGCQGPRDTGPATTIPIVPTVPSGPTLPPQITDVPITPSVPSGEVLPPDPATVATPLDQTTATDFGTANGFLYTGDNPIQTGVAPGTIEKHRMAILRGKVLDIKNHALPGVTIAILGHQELGQTKSRADGMFDIAVNGGGRLTITYDKEGFLPVRRSTETPWQDYAFLPDVTLIARDPKTTKIDLNSSTISHFAQGSVISDTDGTRQAAVMIPVGTQAKIILPDGNMQALSTLNVHLTEYTVGEQGSQAMPADLPPQSAYTYAVEVTADEAINQGIERNGKEVLFDRPVFFYVNNFLDFPAGIAVPMGYYDNDRAIWVPSGNGRVIKLLRLTDGLADLDIDGSGEAANASALSELLITDAERRELAGRYAIGTSLWRVPITHFSKWDANWGSGPPKDATAPDQPSPQAGLIDNPNIECGSIINCETQVLGEALDLVGTPFRLHYASDRVSGYRVGSGLRISLSGASIPKSLHHIELVVRIAGQSIQSYYASGPNQSATFYWDGKDGYGRVLQGAHPVSVDIGYVYDAVYERVERFGYNGQGMVIEGDAARRQLTIWQKWHGTISRWASEPQQMGSWSLSVQHAYDPGGNALYLGDGRQVSTSATTTVVKIVAGGGNPGDQIGDGGDGGVATQANLYPSALAIGPDGSLYIANSNSVISSWNRVRKVSPDGIITTIAGGGKPSDGVGDGGPATEARLDQPQGIALGLDGSLYIADMAHHLIRKVDPSGIITTVAGTTPRGYNGDGIPAVTAKLSFPYGIAVGPDNSLYIADTGNSRIRRVGPDGIITTVAGHGSYTDGGDGGPATAAKLAFPSGVAVGPDGSLYIADNYNGRIRKIGPNGIITTVAGGGNPLDGVGDGLNATEARLKHPQSVSLGPDGSLYIADKANQRIRRVSPEGLITTVAGNGIHGDVIDGSPSTQTALIDPIAVAVRADGRLYSTTGHTAGPRIVEVKPVLPDFAPGDIMLASRDGSEIYQFDAFGRHLRTMDALTGALRYQFSYDSVGRLTSVNDANGNKTTIERDARGDATAIVGPYGQRTTLTMDAHGYLATVTNPAGESTRLNHSANGLLAGMSDPRGNTHTFRYNAQGLLLEDTDPAGGSKGLARIGTVSNYTVTLTSTLGRITSYLMHYLPTDDLQRETIRPDGTRTKWLIGANGSSRITYPSGAMATQMLGPDPRWGMVAPIAASTVITTPGGMKLSVSQGQSVKLADPSNALSLVSLTSTDSINGRTATSSYLAATRTFIDTTAAGRRANTILDEQGRVIKAQVAGLQPVNLSYDSRGRLQSATQGTGADARTITFSYDSAGYLETATDPLGRMVRFSYDAAGRVTRQTTPDGQVINYAYDANGNVTSITPPGRPAHAFTYTPVDLQASYTAPVVGAASAQTQYSYNPDRQFIRVARPDGFSVEIGYDSAGRLSSLTMPHGTATYGYDAATGKLDMISAPGGIKLGYSYDSALLTGVRWSGPISGTVGYRYDNDFRIAATMVNGADPIAYQYDADSLLTKAGELTLSRDAQNGSLTGSTLGSVTDRIGYNDFGEPESYNAGFKGKDLYIVRYSRDKLGRITQQVETIGGVATTYDYGYDQAGRLVEVKQNSVVVATYTYDSNGNRLTAPGITSAAYDAQDRLLRYGNTTYTYTANGELTTKTASGQTTTYQYDVLGNLVAVTLPDGTQLNYLVDGQNRRIGKLRNGTLEQGFLYQGQLAPIAELDGKGNIVSRFVYATHINVPDYMIKGGITYRILTDHLGSPRLVVNDATGEVVQRMDYDAWGNLTQDSNPGFQPFGFAGSLYDRDMGLVRFGARDYDSETGRWTARDSIGFQGGSNNLYSYVLNDPINRKDLFGLWELNIDLYAPGGGIGVSVGSYGGRSWWSIRVGLGVAASISFNPYGRPYDEAKGWSTGFGVCTKGGFTWDKMQTGVSAGYKEGLYRDWTTMELNNYSKSISPSPVQINPKLGIPFNFFISGEAYIAWP